MFDSIIGRQLAAAFLVASYLAATLASFLVAVASSLVAVASSLVELVPPSWLVAVG